MHYRWGRVTKGDGRMTPAARIMCGLVGLFMLGFGLSIFMKYSGLAISGKDAQARVVSYAPEYTHSKGRTTTHHHHYLEYDKMVRKVELWRQYSPGATVDIVYLPSNPSVAAEGKKSMGVMQLMGRDQFTAWLLTIIGLFLLFVTVNAPQEPGGSWGPSNFRFGTAVPPTGLPGIPPPQAGPVGPLPKVDVKVNFKFNINTRTMAENPPASPVSSGAYSKYGFDVMDTSYSLYTADRTAMRLELEKRYGHLTGPQLDDICAMADAMDYEASETANNVDDGLYTPEQAIANLKKIHPGFSDEVYSRAVSQKRRA